MHCAIWRGLLRTEVDVSLHSPKFGHINKNGPLITESIT